MDIILSILNGFVKNILTKPAFFIGFLVLIGYLLDGKKWYEALAGFIKATVGYMILMVGSGGLVSTFRPILTGLKDRFNISATVIDPYFGQNAVTEGMEHLGKSFSQVMILLLVAFIVSCYSFLVNSFLFSKVRTNSYTCYNGNSIRTLLGCW